MSPLDRVIIHLSGITTHAQELLLQHIFYQVRTLTLQLSHVSLIIFKYMSALSIIAYLLPSPSITFQLRGSLSVFRNV